MQLLLKFNFTMLQMREFLLIFRDSEGFLSELFGYSLVGSNSEMVLSFYVFGFSTLLLEFILHLG